MCVLGVVVASCRCLRVLLVLCVARMGYLDTVSTYDCVHRHRTRLYSMCIDSCEHHKHIGATRMHRCVEIRTLGAFLPQSY